MPKSDTVSRYGPRQEKRHAQRAQLVAALVVLFAEVKFIAALTLWSMSVVPSLIAAAGLGEALLSFVVGMWWFRRVACKLRAMQPLQVEMRWPRFAER